MTPTVYRFFDDNGSLLYIGKTISPRERLKNHRKSKDWFDDVARIEMQHFDTEDQALRAEREAIVAESPKHNIVYNRQDRPPEPPAPKPAQSGRFHVHYPHGREAFFDTLTLSVDVGLALFADNFYEHEMAEMGLMECISIWQNYQPTAFRPPVCDDGTWDRNNPNGVHWMHCELSEMAPKADLWWPFQPDHVHESHYTVIDAETGDPVIWATAATIKLFKAPPALEAAILPYISLWQPTFSPADWLEDISRDLRGGVAMRRQPEPQPSPAAAARRTLAAKLVRGGMSQ